jgi:integrase
MAEAVLKSLESGFRNKKHAQQWRNTLAVYAANLSTKPVNTIGADEVLAALNPIWIEKPETASRVRGRIEKVLDAAKARGFREGDNPARWKGHLDHLLAKQPKLSRGHHAALHYSEMRSFMNLLRDRRSIAASALEFCILTAARSGEVLGARWSEFDFDINVWTVPATRMKAGREHRVPLSPRSLALLDLMRSHCVSEFVFPGQKLEKPLSNMAMEMVLRRMNRGDITVHGFRSSFRDWAGDVNGAAREVAEAALAHVIGGSTEQAYRRNDAIEKRRPLMQEWALYCEP